MKITVCMSVDFTEQAKKYIELLKSNGHKVFLPFYTEKILNKEISFEEYIKTKQEKGDTLFREKAKIDLIKRHFNLIKNSDAILVMNFEKRGIKNYVGGSTLMEMGFAYGNDKKIFLLNPIPERGERMHYVDEIVDMKPVIINGDLSMIK